MFPSNAITEAGLISGSTSGTILDSSLGYKTILNLIVNMDVEGGGSNVQFYCNGGTSIPFSYASLDSNKFAHDSTYEGVIVCESVDFVNGNGANFTYSITYVPNVWSENEQMNITGSITSIDPSQILFNGILLFFVVFLGLIFYFKGNKAMR